MIKYICKICNKEFWHYKCRKRKYCSKKCRNIKTQEDRKRHKKLMNKLWQNSKFRKHMSEVHKGYKPTIEQRKKIGLSHKGKRLTEEHKKKIGFTMMGSKNWNWKGGIRIVKRGYIDILKPEHPFATKKGYIRRSRLVMEQKIGRFLKPKEIVHHKGIHFPISSIENRQDDSPENLKLFSNESEHQKYHKPKGSMIGRNKITHI